LLDGPCRLRHQPIMRVDEIESTREGKYALQETEIELMDRGNEIQRVDGIGHRPMDNQPSWFTAAFFRPRVFPWAVRLTHVM